MSKTYNSVQEMLDDMDNPELADYYRQYAKKWSVRFRKWRQIRWLLLRIKLSKLFGGQP